MAQNATASPNVCFALFKGLPLADAHIQLGEQSFLEHSGNKNFGMRPEPWGYTIFSA